MSIDIAIATNEVAKMAVAKLDYPPEVLGMKVLAKALAKHAQSETHAAAVVDGWIEKWPQWPKPSEITQLCQAVADPKQANARAARESCNRCNGTGWVETPGEFGMTAAYVCTHQPMTDSDARMGLKIPPAARAGYMREQREAEPRAELWRGSGGKPNADELRRVNLATIGRIVDHVSEADAAYEAKR